MTYEDIIDWTEGTEYDVDNYDDFDEWVSAIKADFASHGHYFPESTVKELEDYWVDVRQAELEADDDDDEDEVVRP